MKFGNELRKAMIDKGIDTVEQLVELTGMTKGKVNRILNSDGSSRIIDVINLAKFFNIEFTWTVMSDNNND